MPSQVENGWDNYVLRVICPLDKLFILYVLYFYKWDIIGKFGYIGGKMEVIEACPPVNQIILKMLISQNEYS